MCILSYSRLFTKQKKTVIGIYAIFAELFTELD